MSALPQGGAILGTSTVAAAPVLANTGVPAEVSIVLGVAIFIVLTIFYFISKFRNNKKK